MKLEGKNILVIGGSSGIGLALIKKLRAEQANVYAVSRSATADWPETVQFFSGDVLESLEGMEAFLPAQLHGLVYAVGSINLKPFGRLTDEDFLKDFNLNVLGAVRVIRQAMRALKSAAGASVVLVSSVAAKTGMPYHASIAAAKGAIEGLAKTLAAELAFQNVRVNVVAPSLTDTPMAASLLSTAEKREASAKRHPLGKIGQPEDISQLIAFLLADDSAWITGQIIGVDGGLGALKTN